MDDGGSPHVDIPLELTMMEETVVSVEKVRGQSVELDVTKAAGPVRTHPTILRPLVDELAAPFVSLFNKSLSKRKLTAVRKVTAVTSTRKREISPRLGSQARCLMLIDASQDLEWSDAKDGGVMAALRPSSPLLIWSALDCDEREEKTVLRISVSKVHAEVGCIQEFVQLEEITAEKQQSG
ncbi:hypothetical protein AHF37_09008 [Paragonimus kellicotti]|nr:hypothetical protein AHF37_09008 [Paragonimus kellicotti]